MYSCYVKKTNKIINKKRLFVFTNKNMFNCSNSEIKYSVNYALLDAIYEDQQNKTFLIGNHK